MLVHTYVFVNLTLHPSNSLYPNTPEKKNTESLSSSSTKYPEISYKCWRTSQHARTEIITTTPTTAATMVTTSAAAGAKINVVTPKTLKTPKQILQWQQQQQQHQQQLGNVESWTNSRSFAVDQHCGNQLSRGEIMRSGGGGYILWFCHIIHPPSPSAKWNGIMADNKSA